MRRVMLSALAGLLISLGTAEQAMAECGTDTIPCETASGRYFVSMPEGHGPHPALVFLHGYGSNGQNAVRAMQYAVERGMFVIGPQGLKSSDGRRSWSFHPNRPERLNESKFVREVIDDATERFDIDRSQILLSGFSIGGSMTSYIACREPDIVRAFAPLAGSFWRPHPPLNACTGPVRLFHTHGWRDGTVPLEGRPLGGGAIIQGDVFYAMQVWRNTNDCHGLKADSFKTGEGYWRRRWTGCQSGDLEFALHPGGHVIPDGWTDMVLDWFEGL